MQQLKSAGIHLLDCCHASFGMVCDQQVFGRCLAPDVHTVLCIRPAPAPPAGYVNVVIVSFAQPDCTYVKGSLSFTGTGLQFSSAGPVVKDAIAALKSAHSNTRVLLAVGGATYYNFAGMNTQCIKDIVDDFGFDGE